MVHLIPVQVSRGYILLLGVFLFLGGYRGALNSQVRLQPNLGGGPGVRR